MSDTIEMKTDVRRKVTDRIVAQLEKGVRPWREPWNVGHAAGRITRPLRSNGVPYRGVNVLLLWLSALERGYSAPLWLTYKQAREFGGQVRKGEKGSLVVYANRVSRIETDEATGEERERGFSFMKGYTVFNAEQVEGLPPHFHAVAEPRLDPAQRNAQADEFFAATRADIRHGGDRAYYAMAEDRVHMPPFESFRDADGYYATLAHELTHWTRHPSRLNREFGRKRWGDEGYAMEELVAELGAAFLSADLDLTPEPHEDHAAYIASWLKVLKNDPRAIFAAASYAQNAADYLAGLQFGEEQADPSERMAA